MDLELQLLRAFAFTLVFEGNDPPNPDPNPNPNPDPDPTADPSKKKEKVVLTPAQQAFVNSQLAEERRKGQKKNDELIAQLETQRNRADTTMAERTTLEERIEALKSDYATKEELATRDTTKKIKDLEVKAATEAAEKDLWRKRFEGDKKKVDLTGAAVTEKAFNPDQVVIILQPLTRLVETVGDDGKPTGEFETRVRIPTKDKEGKPVTLDLTPLEAVKQLKEMPDQYGNLFISGANGGLGGGSLGNRQGGKKDPAQMTTAEYMAERRAQRTKGKK